MTDCDGSVGCSSRIDEDDEIRFAVGLTCGQLAYLVVLLLETYRQMRLASGAVEAPGEAVEAQCE